MCLNGADAKIKLSSYFFISMPFGSQPEYLYLSIGQSLEFGGFSFALRMYKVIQRLARYHRTEHRLAGMYRTYCFDDFLSPNIFE